MILTARQKADWVDRYTSDQWQQAMDVKAFPAIISALTEGDLDRADQLMQQTFSVKAGQPATGSVVPAPATGQNNSMISDAIRERDAYFAEAARVKDTLSEIMPALERASHITADELRASCPGSELTPDEWAALWMARAILERD